MFGRFFKKSEPEPVIFNDGVIERVKADSPPEVTVFHLIIEQSLADKATEVLMQHDRFRNEFAVYFKRNDSFEEVLAPPPSLFVPIQTMLALAGGLKLPEDEGQFIFPRESGGRLRFSIAIEDDGATMALSPLGYC